MKILVCFQITNEYEPLTFNEWNDLAGGRDVLSYAKKVIDKVDEAGIEMALRLRDACAAADENVEVDAVTVANSFPEGFATMLFAAGVRSVILLRTGPDAYPGATAIAESISGYTRQEKYDLVFAGCRSSRGEEGRVGILTSEMLGWEAYSGVQTVSFDNGDVLKVECRTGDGFIKYGISTPAVCIIDDSYPVYLRIPTLKERLRAAEKKIIIRDAQTLSAAHDPVPVSLSAVDRRRKCTMLDPLSEEDMQKLKELIRAK